MNKIKRKRRTFTDDFKHQMVSLYQHGKSRSEIVADRGKEFDNRLLADCFKTFNITHSLSKKGCPYDNAVAEATFKTIKTEFVKGQRFN
ncbi:DDE-type integrase/transposase/recombinase [Gilliamella sp. Lep-s21]|nr:DDE-type integrase/transposase/recombinase [Gilliamella sp. Lep-s35]MWP70224.1 DDE-type integrase/transposase/recombinase [Gilliamella sp. Lep-s5]MWP78440.1 DDE-type integrase/transposase/recombinase [Gilliamella sp. Lep-s21]